MIKSRIESNAVDKSQKAKQQPIQKINNPTKAQLASVNDLGIVIDKVNKKLYVKVDNQTLVFIGALA